ncbi:MAG TPA: M23 family metallopeptidase [Burkholderiales bacterium]|nr:M23 family metallopeptidase [Burkholderiales bacterium]
MNIILVSGNLGKSRTITLSHSQIVFIAVLLLIGIAAFAIALHYLTLRHAAEIKSPYLQSLLVSVQEQELRKQQAYLRENLNAMAVKLGQMQAQLLRLDALGDRLAKQAGFKPQEFMFDQLPGRGGAVSGTPQRDLTLNEFNQQMERLSKELNDRTDKLGILETALMQDRLKQKLVPSVPPVNTGWFSSNFGWRIDPFTGSNAFHEGVDFMSEGGSTVVAAGGGVVVYSADNHTEYGNMIEVDHGNGLVTRYAHLSKRLVKVGDVVLREGKIGEVGNTGRSTGPHLHFEVRFKGAPQNPVRFLHKPG